VTALQAQPRVLTRQDGWAVGDLIALDPVLNGVFDARWRAASDVGATRLGGSLWGLADDLGTGLRAAVFHGGNLIPIGTDLSALRAIATHIADGPRGCSSIVGEAQAVAAMWPALERTWGPARAIRMHQPFLVADRPSDIKADGAVRVVDPSELGEFLPAAVAMFTEELGVSPIGPDSGANYRTRLAGVIQTGRAFARFDRRGEVEFKAEIGALTPATAQIQGVWVRPELRGRGLGTSAMAWVLSHALRMAPTVSLYVNDFNSPARRMYERLGFQQVHTLSTILF